MSSLLLLNSSEVMPFLILTAVFLFIGPVLFMRITTIWSNIKQKVFDEFYARTIKIVNDLDTSEIEKTFIEFNDKLTAKVDMSISNFKSTFIAEISKIYAKIDGKLIAEAEKNKSITNDSEAKLENSGDSTSASTNSSPSSSSSESSNLSGILDITSDIKICFKQHFDQLMKARNYTFDEICFLVVVNIHSFGGNIKFSTVKNFYNGVSNKEAVEGMVEESTIR
ncbi:hypothetical protein C1645_839971 [Glomus cerebriforme]|uniref:Uncharacterized protein n=1 Tax=Glomus cerebriforme TaxID=658196 RepID=A0A397S4U6_9GLOM|nr:hypothetical protein C1645_839971 [Glomus cerebriforme]